MQNCPRQLAMQSCVLCSFVRCGTSKTNKKKKKEKKKVCDISFQTETQVESTDDISTISSDILKEFTIIHNIHTDKLCSLAACYNNTIDHIHYNDIAVVTFYSVQKYKFQHDTVNILLVYPNNLSKIENVIYILNHLFIYLFRCPTSYERAQNTRLHRYLTRAILHIASLLAAHTLNTYNLWKLTLRGHLNTDVQAGLELGTFRSRERCLNR